MREIKFRAWDKNRQVMVANVELVELKPNKEYWDWTVNGLFQNHCDWLVWMQYTGLKDKNGKEIYEGDIVKSKISGKLSEVVFEEYAFELKRFNKFGSNFDDDGQAFMNGYLDWFKNNELEVVGNIYENEDLIK